MKCCGLLCATAGSGVCCRVDILKTFDPYNHKASVWTGSVLVSAEGAKYNSIGWNSFAVKPYVYLGIFIRALNGRHSFWIILYVA